MWLNSCYYLLCKLPRDTCRLPIWHHIFEILQRLLSCPVIGWHSLKLRRLFTSGQRIPFYCLRSQLGDKRVPITCLSGLWGGVLPAGESRSHPVLPRGNIRDWRWAADHDLPEDTSTTLHGLLSGHMPAYSTHWLAHWLVNDGLLPSVIPE